VVTVNGVIVTNLVFSGSLLNWNVSYPHLLANTTYTVTISATDLNGNLAATSVSFDTFSPANYTWEAEDFDHDGGQFIDNPQTNAYLGLAAIVDVDTHQVNFAGVDLYRPNGMDTEINGDSKRAQYLGIGNTNVDYTVGYFSGGSWLNYTRHYPAGSYNVYGRLAAGNGNATSVTLSKVTGGWGTTSQTTNFLGTFNVASTGWESYNLIPLRDDSGNLVTVALNGSTNTLQVGIPVGVLSDCNVNFLMLVPASSVSITLTATISSGTITIAFPTQNGSSYQLLYKNSLTDLSWTPIGSPLSGNGSIESINQPVSGTMRFYRVQIQ
jgi:archaellum component FlaF (FlaF/FlaG flagellin family)